MADHLFDAALKHVETQVAESKKRVLSASFLQEYFPECKDLRALDVEAPCNKRSYGHDLLVFEIGKDGNNKIVVWPDWQRAAILVGGRRFDWEVVLLEMPSNKSLVMRVRLRSPSKKSFMVFEQHFPVYFDEELTVV